MILLDTHIWVWWAQGDPKLSSTTRARLQADERHGLGVSIISCLEVARLVAYGRLVLPLPIDQWVATALAYPNVNLIQLTPSIAVESTRLPGTFHKDPCDRIIVATARELKCPLATADSSIREYPDVMLID